MRVGLIGIGYIGIHHLRNLHRLMKEDLIDELYVSDIDFSKKRLAEKYNAKFYQFYEEMLEKEDLDAVSIAVPTIYHKDVSLKAIQNGVHILIEKPFTYTLDSALKIIDAAKRENVKIMVGYVERFNPAISKLKELVDNRELGDLISLSARRLGGPRIIDCGVVLDLGVHDIDIMLYITGKNAVKVHTFALKRLPEVANEDYAMISMLFEDNIMGHVEISRITPVKTRELDITGTKSFVKVNYIDQEIRLIESFLKEKGAKWSDFKEFVSKFTPKETALKIVKEEPLYLELKTFINSVDSGKDPPVSAEDALKTLRIATAAIESYKKKKAISLQ